jgi:hypothetical protein
MVLSVQRRVSSGVSVNANYTWSHCIGDYATLSSGMAMWASDTYADPNNRGLDRGNCSADRRQVFNVTSVAETPQFGNAKLRLLASGWRLSGIYRKSSGDWMTITTGSDIALNGSQVNAGGTTIQRVDQLTANPYGDRTGEPNSSWLLPTAFANPATGKLGTLGRNSLQAPGSWSFDMALSRIFRFREDQRVEFRAEAYNVTNSFRPGNPSTSLSSSNFGLIRSSSSPRILQFALKYVF